MGIFSLASSSDTLAVGLHKLYAPTATGCYSWAPRRARSKEDSVMKFCRDMLSGRQLGTGQHICLIASQIPITTPATMPGHINNQNKTFITGPGRFSECSRRSVQLGLKSTERRSLASAGTSRNSPRLHGETVGRGERPDGKGICRPPTNRHRDRQRKRVPPGPDERGWYLR